MELAGEKKLSNATIETFTQESRQHCFRCHDTRQAPLGGGSLVLGPKKINISHILINAYLQGKELQKSGEGN